MLRVFETWAQSVTGTGTWQAAKDTKTDKFSVNFQFYFVIIFICINTRCFPIPFTLFHWYIKCVLRPLFEQVINQLYKLRRGPPGALAPSIAAATV